MTTKTIKVTQEAYSVLKRYKKKKETFSNVIVRKLGKRINLSEFVGIVSDETANEMKKQIKESRRLSEKRIKELEAMWRK